MAWHLIRCARLLGVILAFICGASWGVKAQPAPSEMVGGYWAGAGCNAVTFSGPKGSRTVMVDVNGNLCISGSFSVSIAGFTPVTTGTPIAVTTGGVTGTLPAGTVVVASNVGATNGAYCKLGASATTSDQLIPPNSWFAFTVGAATQLTCITGASTTTVNMVGGSGIPTGSGGGGGGGSGGAVTIADGADVTLGAKADAKSTATDTTPITIMSVLKQVSASVQAAAASLATAVTSLGSIVTNTTGASTAANQATANTSLATIATNSAAAIPAGAALIGNVGTGYPAGSTPITASTTGTTGATTATLAASASIKTYICGFAIRANATAAATANSTVTGTVTGTLNFTQWTAPAASGIGLTEEIFSPCVVSSAINTAIAVVSAAPGTGGVVSVTAWGYQQ